MAELINPKAGIRATFLGLRDATYEIDGKTVNSRRINFFTSTGGKDFRATEDAIRSAEKIAPGTVVDCEIVDFSADKEGKITGMIGSLRATTKGAA